MKKSRIIISDVHGCLKTLKALLEKLPEGVPITFAGDLVDRGKDSNGVVEFVKSGGYDCVMGNHEDMMIRECRIIDENGKDEIWVDYYHSVWLANGGFKTLHSYHDENGKEDVALIKSHIEWMKTLPDYIEYKDIINEKDQYLIVSHSTAAQDWEWRNSPNPAKKQQFSFKVKWDRNPMPPQIKNAFNVYGHTPQAKGAVIKDHFACIDGGAYFSHGGNYGKMIALQFPEMIVYEQENIEDE